jgi:hypothetical protein
VLTGAGLLSVVPLAQPASATATAIALSVDRTNEGLGGSVELTAVTNGVPYPYRIDIFDTTTNDIVAYCDTNASTCTGYATAWEGEAGDHVYQALVGRYSPTWTGAAAYAQVRSNNIHVFWWDVTLTASASSAFVTTPVALFACANRPVELAGYTIDIYEGLDSLASCSTGATCAAAVSQFLPGCHWYDARINDWSGIVVTAYPVEVCWYLV